MKALPGELEALRAQAPAESRRRSPHSRGRRGRARSPAGNRRRRDIDQQVKVAEREL